LCSHKSAGHKKDNERCALEGVLFFVQHPLQVRQSFAEAKAGNPASATQKPFEGNFRGFFIPKSKR